jgi:hypothetical protein
MLEKIKATDKANVSQPGIDKFEPFTITSSDMNTSPTSCDEILIL